MPANHPDTKAFFQVAILLKTIRQAAADAVIAATVREKGPKEAATEATMIAQMLTPTLSVTDPQAGQSFTLENTKDKPDLQIGEGAMGGRIQLVLPTYVTPKILAYALNNKFPAKLTETDIGALPAPAGAYQGTTRTDLQTMSVSLARLLSKGGMAATG